MDFEISYSDSTFELFLSIDAAGAARLTIGSNRADPGFDKLGLFQGHISPQRLDQLAADMRAAEFQKIDNPESALSGEPVQQLRLKEADQEIMKWAAYSTPPPPAFISMEERLLAVARELRKHPTLAIAVGSRSFPSHLERDEPVQITLWVSNPGTNVLKLQHPRDWSRDVANLRLMALRSDIPMEELAQHHQRLTDVGVADIVDIQGGQVEKHFLTLPPGQTVFYSVNLKPDWPPGRYNVEIFFAATLFDQDEKEQVHCTYLTHPLHVTVTGKEKPEDVPEDVDDET